MTDQGYSVRVADGYDEAVVRTRMALRVEGFSILTEMHVGGLLGPEAGSERQYLIMGAWAAPSARRTIEGSGEVELHLPCNVVVAERGTSAVVAALDPADTVGSQDEASQQVAGSARAALQRVLTRLSEMPA